MAEQALASARRKKLNPQQTGALVMQRVLARIKRELTVGGAVQLRGVGQLEAFRKKGTTYRHPQTGELEKTRPCRYVRFNLSSLLRKKLRG